MCFGRLAQLAGMPAEMTCRTWLIETESGLVLVDTGYGYTDLMRYDQRSMGALLLSNFPERREDLIDRVLLKSGYRLRDVRHVVVTHLDRDHVGGIEFFPWAELHVPAAEYEYASRPQARLIDRYRYANDHWSHHQGKIHQYAAHGSLWFGFPSVQPLNGLPPELLMVPLPGHSYGHGGVAVQARQGWMLHVGDAIYHNKELTVKWGDLSLMRTLQKQIAYDWDAFCATQNRLSDFAKTNQAQIVCSHGI